MTLGVAWFWWTPWVVVPAILIIATQQHAMFVLAHDAAHYRLFQNRALNDAVGRFIGSITGISMCAYRVVHRLHHNYLYGPEDPDIALHGGYPRGKGYLLRKLATDVAGLTAWKTYKYFFGAPAANAATREAQRPLDDTSPALRRAAQRDRWGILAFQIGAPIALAALFGWAGLLKYAVLWMLPAVTVLQVILRVRAICEHGAPRDHASPLTAARTNLAGPLPATCAVPSSRELPHRAPSVSRGPALQLACDCTKRCVREAYSKVLNCAPSRRRGVACTRLPSVDRRQISEAGYLQTTRTSEEALVTCSEAACSAGYRE